MTEAKHTPGPWLHAGIHRVERQPNGEVAIHLDQPITHYGIRYVYRDEQSRRCTVQIAQAYITSRREHEAESNARLIAAAPDLLAATKELLEVAQGYSGFDDADFSDDREPCSDICNHPMCREMGCILDKVHRARSAIAKAEGPLSSGEPKMTPDLEKHIKDQFLERDATIARLRAENERLVLGIQNFLDGDYEPRLKGAEKCKHGEFPWNACEACIEEHFQRVLNPQQSGDSNG